MTESALRAVSTEESEASPEEGPARAPRGGTALRRVVLGVSSVALFAVIVWFGGVESWRTLLSGDPRLYALVFVLTGFVPVLSAWRLRTLIEASTGRDVAPLRRFFHINMTGIALGLFLPRNAALLGGKATYLRTIGVPILRGSWGVIMENVVDLLFLGLIVVPCVAVFAFGIGPAGFIGVNLGCLVAMLAFAFWMRGRDWRGFLVALVQRIPMISRRLPMPEGGFVPGAVRAVPMLLVTVLIHTAMAGRAYAVALAIGLEPSWVVFAAAYPLTQLGLVLAVAPGAIGTLDASWLGLLLLGGLSNADALSFTVALRACIVVFPIAWYGISALVVLTLPREASTAPEPVAD